MVTSKLFISLENLSLSVNICFASLKCDFWKKKL